MVLLEVRALTERGAAHQAGEWLGPSVHQYVASEVAFLGKSHITVLAAEGPLARVVTIVNLERVFGRQHFQADVTLIILDRKELLRDLVQKVAARGQPLRDLPSSFA